MELTINWEDVKPLIEKALKDYENETNIITFAVAGGHAAGIIKLSDKLSGVPAEEIQAYRERLEGIGELRQMGFGKPMETIEEELNREELDDDF